MAGQYLYTTKGYNGGWSADSTDLKRSAGGGSWLSVADNNKSAFFRTDTGWRRFFSGINSDGTLGAGSFIYYTAGDGSGTATVTIQTDGIITVNDGSGNPYWDPAGYPDNPDIEIYATKTSGVMTYVTGPALLTWHTLNTNRGWSMTCSSGTSSGVTLSVQFRHIPTNIILATITISLNVEYISG